MQNMSLNIQKIRVPHKQQLDSFFFNNQRHQIHSSYQPLQHHLYAVPPPHLSNLGQKTYHHFFISDRLRVELLEKNEQVHQVLDPNGSEAQSLPREVHTYHTLFPIQNQVEKHSRVFGLATSLYKAIRTLDGKAYCLRRIENFRIANEMSISLIEAWGQIQHSGIVQVREGFTTKAFGDTCHGC
jgi:PAB-dependent poly(A)-specific ribonuclease subunit 3